MSLGINLCYKLGMIVHPYNPNTWEVRQEDHSKFHYVHFTVEESQSWMNSNLTEAIQLVMRFSPGPLASKTSE